MSVYMCWMGVGGALQFIFLFKTHSLHLLQTPPHLLLFPLATAGGGRQRGSCSARTAWCMGGGWRSAGVFGEDLKKRGVSSPFLSIFLSLNPSVPYPNAPNTSKFSCSYRRFWPIVVFPPSFSFLLAFYPPLI